MLSTPTANPTTIIRTDASGFVKTKQIPLDPALLTLDDKELEFFHATVSQDDEHLKNRILDVQKQAYAYFAFPCIRLFHHVRLMMAEHPVYDEVLKAGKSGDTILIDIGCCMGTDARKLVYDGYPGSNILGVDIVQRYMDLGHELYNDTDSCAISFLDADILKVPDAICDNARGDTPLSQITELAQLRGSVTHVYAGALFHLFSEEKQYDMAYRMALLLEIKPGAIIFGRHEGFDKAGKIDDPPQWKTNRWGHSPSTLSEMWKKVFTAIHGTEFTETRVEVSAYISDQFGGGDEAHLRRSRAMLIWAVRIV